MCIVWKLLLRSSVNKGSCGAVARSIAGGGGNIAARFVSIAHGPHVNRAVERADQVNVLL